MSPFWFVSHSDLRKECRRSFSLFLVYSWAGCVFFYSALDEAVRRVEDR